MYIRIYARSYSSFQIGTKVDNIASLNIILGPFMELS